VEEFVSGKFGGVLLGMKGSQRQEYQNQSKRFRAHGFLPLYSKNTAEGVPP